MGLGIWGLAFGIQYCFHSGESSVLWGLGLGVWDLGIVVVLPVSVQYCSSRMPDAPADWLPAHTRMSTVSGSYLGGWGFWFNLVFGSIYSGLRIEKVSGVQSPRPGSPPCRPRTCGGGGKSRLIQFLFSINSALRTVKAHTRISTVSGAYL